MLYVAVDVGCIECGENSAVLGVFESKERAEQVAKEHYSRQSDHWHGQHSFEVFEVPAVNEEVRQQYE